MLFNSPEYLLFLPAVAILYYLVPHRLRWVLLLIASYVFYISWNPRFLVLIIFSTLFNYAAAILIYHQNTLKNRKLLLAAAILINFGLLGYFKYTNFILHSLNVAAGAVNAGAPFSTLDIILPVGISFYTFQTVSYVIDVYRGKLEPERHAGVFAVYVAFFPQLVAGPIERARNLLPQFKRRHPFLLANLTEGLKLIIIGMFKKVVLADRLAIYVNTVYADTAAATDLQLIIATWMFAFQILMDFSGYSDIAIGSARILGIDLMKNFDFPYLATSVTDFWRRWHISLTTWFTDYIYIPLGGNRKGQIRKYFNILIVFFISGVWHGAGWSFVVWGLLNGIYLVIEDLTGLRKAAAGRFAAVVRGIVTFNLIAVTWVFFRSDSLAGAVRIFMDLIQFEFVPGTLFVPFGAFGFFQTVLVLVMGIILGGVLYLRHTGRLTRWYPAAVVYMALVFLIVIFGSFGNREFIYFQF
ncbi:MAG: Peptidoglycan O-acetyltransferase [candidate division WS6 bacterium OLB20]|uniref:Peptidoglycan O-acetyltransferase n=1 Tax=candidate division WS6 bacterium OLB20 TaxID=1617426 RepID=A0A136LWP6_9BACT|nr:MAG: Peptidoglycan O-acetyltransferase [candidate division WS6 bacterium OLB20]